MFSVLALSVGATGVRAQDSSTLTADQLAAAIVVPFNESQKDLQHYTYTYVINAKFWNSSGVLFRSQTSHVEVVMVDGAPFVRAATGDKAERHSKAVVPMQFDSQSIDTLNQAKARSQKERALDRPDSVARYDHLPNLLATEYQNRITGKEKVYGQECVILESRPRDTLNDPDAQTLLRIWVKADTLAVLRFRIELLPNHAEPDGGGFAVDPAGSFYDTTYAPVNGVLLPFHRIHDARRTTSTHVVGYKQDITYAAYQRYVATMRIVPPS